MKIKWIHSGQSSSYSPSEYIAEIYTEEELTDSQVEEVLKQPHRLPKGEWLEKQYNISDYFKGWYTIIKTEYGYNYHGVYPYDD